MSRLAELMRKARRFNLEVDGLRLVLTRPTDQDAAQLFRGNISAIDAAKKFVVDWSGITEADLIPSGGSDAVPFDADVWAEYVADHSELWEPLTEAITASWSEHNEAREDRAKN